MSLDRYIADAQAALAASAPAQAGTKRRNEEAARAAAFRAEAAAMGAELDPESIEQGDTP